MSCPNNCADEGSHIIIERDTLPEVEARGHFNIAAKVDWPVMKNQVVVDKTYSSGNLRSIALGYLALAEYQYAQEHQVFDERDLIATELFERGWVTLNIMERDVVKRAQATGRWARKDWED